MAALTLWPIFAAVAVGFVTCAVFVRYGLFRDPREG